MPLLESDETKNDSYRQIWIEAAQSSIQSLDKVQNNLRCLAVVELFSMQQFPTLAREHAYRYFYWKYSGGLNSLLSPVLTFTDKSCYVMYTDVYFVFYWQ